MNCKNIYLANLFENVLICNKCLCVCKNVNINYVIHNKVSLINTSRSEFSQQCINCHLIVLRSGKIVDLQYLRPRSSHNYQSVWIPLEETFQKMYTINALINTRYLKAPPVLIRVNIQHYTEKIKKGVIISAFRSLCIQIQLSLVLVINASDFDGNSR